MIVLCDVGSSRSGRGTEREREEGGGVRGDEKLTEMRKGTGPLFIWRG